MQPRSVLVRAFVPLCLVCVLASPSFGQSPEAKATLDDIRATLGSVPTFFTLFPEEALPAAWGTMKNIQMSPSTALSGKIKELIGLGVASQIPCEYCVYFHTRAAKLNGATDREIHEAVAEAALTRFWSTYLNGAEVDLPTFQSEVRKMIDRAMTGEAPPPETEVVDAESAYEDMINMAGFVPGFMRDMPEAWVADAWNELKNLEMNPETALSNKVKNLIALAVGSQIPCAYCIYADKQFAKAEGASDEEVSEAIGMAAVTRHWSTFLNGVSLDPEAFQKEIDAVFAHLNSMSGAK